MIFFLICLTVAVPPYLEGKNLSYGVQAAHSQLCGSGAGELAHP